MKILRSVPLTFNRWFAFVTGFAALLCFVLSMTITPIVAQEINTGDDSWIWQNPLPQGNHLSQIWGAHADDAWAVGDNGAILKWIRPSAVQDDADVGVIAPLGDASLGRTSGRHCAMTVAVRCTRRCRRTLAPAICRTSNRWSGRLQAPLLTHSGRSTGRFPAAN